MTAGGKILCLGPQVAALIIKHYTTHDTCLTHGHRKLRLAEDFEMLRLTPDFETLHLTCDFKTLRLMPARRPPDATF